MRASLVILVCGSCLLLLQRYSAPKRPDTKTVAATLDTLNFKTQVQPIFERQCSPCHFPGGKMYERLPFDQGETITSHQVGILRRIKGEDDVRLIKQYLEQGTRNN